MTRVKATVLVCTYNPDRMIFTRVLNGLKVQTAAVEDWELVVVDNNSDIAVSNWLDVSWHPHARVLREPQPGKTFALRRGQAVACSDLLVIVDDDNILCPTYVADAIHIAAEYPFLGAWGGGAVGEFEAALPRWLEPHLSFIAVKECRETVWSNEYFHSSATPIGAGMCIRTAVATKYASMLDGDPLRRMLGPTAGHLARCEDIDMALTAIDMGMGIGRFPNLVLTHVIPSARMTEEYILRLAEESQISACLLRAIRGRPYPPYLSGGWLRRLVKWMRLWALPRMNRRVMQALIRGQQKGHASAAKLLAESACGRDVRHS